MSKHTTPNEPTGRLYGGERTEDRIQRRHEQFLDAGLHLFGTVGFKGTSVRGLCREARLTDRYFYESFASVEDVLVQVYEREMTRQMQAVLATVGELKPGMSIEQLARPALHAYFAVHRDPLVARTVWFEILGVSPRVDALYQNTIQQFGQLMLTLIKTLYPELTLSQSKESLMALCLVGAISQATVAWIISDYESPVDELIDVVILILEGLALRLNQQ